MNTLIFFGDSLTEGVYGGSYVEAARPLLPEYTMRNAGVGGDTILNLQYRLERDVLEHQPDVVFVMVGGNDAISYCQPATRQYYKNTKHVPDGVVTPNMFATAYRDVLTHLQAAHIHVLIGLPPSEANPTVVQTMREYNAISTEIAASLKLPVLDLMAEFAPAQISPDRPTLDMGTILTIGARVKRKWADYANAQREGGWSFTFDGLHLTPDSAAQIGQRVAAFIRDEA